MENYVDEDVTYLACSIILFKDGMPIKLEIFSW